ncbi:MAG: dihydroneopterin aldolase [Alphaproteobacteria bacterium]
MMKIAIKKLHLKALIGEYEYERHAKQDLFFTILLHTSVDVDSVKEDLGKTLDYDALTQRISAFVENSTYRLLETMASDLSDLLLEDPRVLAFDLEIEKPDALEKATVALLISKSRQ